jgi:O-antigen/teichoic acid export membrane protein
MFSVSDYGTLSLIQYTILVLIVLAKFGFQHSVQRYYPEYAESSDPLAVRRYFSTLFFGSGLLSLVLTFLFIGSLLVGLERFLGMAANGIVILASSLVLIRTMRSMQLNLMQMENKTKLYNGIEIFQKAAAVGITILLLFAWTRSVMACFVGMVAVEGAIMLLYVPVLARRGLVSPRLFDFGFLRDAMAFSFPLMVAEISWVGLLAGDRFFVRYFLGLAAVGYYSAASNIALNVQEVVAAPLQLSFFPICMKLWAAEGKEATQRFLSRSLNYYMMMAVLVVCVAIATAQELVVVLASKKFQEARTLLPYLVVGLVLWAMNTFFRPGLLIHKRAQTIAKTTFLASLINIILNLLLLPKFGLKGAAVASVLSFVAMVGFTAFASMRVLPFKIEWLALARYVAIGLAASWVASLIQVGSPLLSAVLKGITILALYASALWLTDVRVRELFSRLVSVIAQYARDRQRVETLAPAEN